MKALDNLRQATRRDRVFDFMLDVSEFEVDVSHGMILYLEDISVSFDGFKAINDLNLYIGVGELRCIIGPNGAGKTRPDAGTASFGQNIDLLHLSEPEIA